MSINGGLYTNPPKGKARDLSSVMPEPVGLVGSPGSSGEGAHADHAHALDSGILEQIDNAAFAAAYLMGGI